MADLPSKETSRIVKIQNNIAKIASRSKIGQNAILRWAPQRMIDSMIHEIVTNAMSRNGFQSELDELIEKIDEKTYSKIAFSLLNFSKEVNEDEFLSIDNPFDTPFINMMKKIKKVIPESLEKNFDLDCLEVLLDKRT